MVFPYSANTVDQKDLEISALEKLLEKESAIQLRNFRAGLISATLPTGPTTTITPAGFVAKTQQGVQQPKPRYDNLVTSSKANDNTTHLGNGVLPNNLVVSASTASTTPSSLEGNVQRGKFGFEDPFLNVLLSAK